MMKKDDLKFLRIANLVEKKLYREAVNGPTKRFSEKDTQEEKQKSNLPSINSKKKFWGNSILAHNLSSILIFYINILIDKLKNAIDWLIIKV